MGHGPVSGRVQYFWLHLDNRWTIFLDRYAEGSWLFHGFLISRCDEVNDRTLKDMAVGVRQTDRCISFLMFGSMLARD